MKKKSTLRAILLGAALILVLAGLVFITWFHLFYRSAVPSRKLEQLSSHMSATEIRALLGDPNWTTHADGVTHWEYWRQFAGIRTDLHLYITLSNGMLTAWHEMD
jgi:hypothetical protein